MSNKEKNVIIQIIGWYGVVAILAAYILVSFGEISSSGLWYQGLNATGSVGILVEAYYKKDYQPVTLNVIWLIVALLSIGKIIF